MLPLDALYGPGSSASLHEAILEPSVFEEHATPSGGVSVNMEWGDHTKMGLHCRREEINFVSLVSRKKGFYGKLCGTTVPRWATERGVLRFISTPASSGSRDALLASGAWVEDGRRLVWDLTR